MSSIIIISEAKGLSKQPSVETTATSKIKVNIWKVKSINKP